METELKAQEILEYCFCLLVDPNNIEEFKETTRYKDMVKEITFLLEND
jgi:hypothetical protein